MNHNIIVSLLCCWVNKTIPRSITRVIEFMQFALLKKIGNNKIDGGIPTEGSGGCGGGGGGVLNLCVVCSMSVSDVHSSCTLHHTAIYKNHPVLNNMLN